MRIAIVEDEAEYAGLLAGYFSQYGKERNISCETVCFADGEDITDQYRPEFDLILLDIRMRFMNGIDTARRIREMDSRVALIFITNEAGFAIRGYEVGALDYVMKPVSYETFSSKIDRARLHIREDREIYVSVREEGGTRRIRVDDILYIESRGHSLIIRTNTGQFMAHSKMSELEAALSSSGFFRCNKGFLVNMHEVQRLVGTDCCIAGERIPVSRRKRAEFIDFLTNLP